MPSNAIVPVVKGGATTFNESKNKFEGDANSEIVDPQAASTPQKNANKKKLKNDVGTAIVQTSTSADSQEERRPAQ